MPVSLDAVVAMAEERPADVAAENERVEVACTGAGESPACTLHATHVLRNRGAGASRVTLYLYGAPAAHVRIDGRDVQASATGASASDAFDADVRRRAGIEPAAPLARSVFVLDLAAGGAVSVSIDGAIRAVDERRGGPSESYAIAPVTTRHPSLGSREVRDRVAEYRVYPLTADATIVSHGSAAVDSAEWIPGPRGEGAFINVVMPGRRFWNGGPLLGIGGSLERAATRGRAGYEVAFPSASTIASFAAESDFKTRSTLAAVYEVASPGAVFLIPSIGAGLGVPVEFRSGSPARVGVRLQVTISFPVFSIVVPLDSYFAGDGPIEAAILGQISL